MKTKEELEQKVETLRTMVQESQVSTSNYTGKLADAEKELADINKPELTPMQFDNLHEAIEEGVDAFDFCDTDNFEIEYGINYDGKVNCDSHEFRNSEDLVEMIVTKVHKLFTEAECPEELDTTEADNHA